MTTDRNSRRTHLELIQCPERRRAAQEAWASATARVALQQHRRRRRENLLSIGGGVLLGLLFFGSLFWWGSTVVERQIAEAERAMGIRR
jgi:hypothetical protein